MNELFETFTNNPTLMLIAAIGLGVGLFIVLVVVISSMRVSSYKERFLNVQYDNKAKSILIDSIQEELQALLIKNVQNEEDLVQFSRTQKKLNTTVEMLSEIQEINSDLTTLNTQTKVKLESTQNMNEKLLKEYEELVARLKLLTEEKSKLSVNNTRLLMKLESKGRVTSSK